MCGILFVRAQVEAHDVWVYDKTLDKDALLAEMHRHANRECAFLRDRASDLVTSGDFAEHIEDEQSFTFACESRLLCATSNTCACMQKPICNTVLQCIYGLCHILANFCCEDWGPLLSENEQTRAMKIFYFHPRRALAVLHFSYRWTMRQPRLR